MKKNVSCIIPFYNEVNRIGAVLKEIIKVKNISEIIAVDGASTDQGFEYVKKNFPQINLIRMIKNQGKTEAVEKGLIKATGDYILLYDADLSNVKAEEIDFVLSRILNDDSIDMIIFSRQVKRLLTKINRFELLFSGERVLKKNDLVNILKNNPTKFQLEIAINKYMKDNKKKVYWFPSSNTNLPKANKFGRLSGLVEDLTMFKQVFSYSPRDYFNQILFFCREKLLEKNSYCVLYIVRHGETEWNIKQIVQGHRDIPLNKKGEEQALNLGKRLKNVKFDKVFSSDLIRAKRTAELIVFENKLAVATTKTLRERNFGSLEGTDLQKYLEILSEFSKKNAKLSFKEKAKLRLRNDVETIEEMMGRFITFLREVAVGYPGKNVLVVTHGGIMRNFILHIGFFSEKDFKFGSISNTAYIRLLCDGVDFIVKETFGFAKNSNK